MHKNPHILQINAFFFLSRMSAKYNKPLNLASIPDDEWRFIADKGFDLIWMMGVWKRSPKARSLALQEPNLRRVYDQLLPGWTEADVTGSPYSIYGYEIDPYLGHEKTLAQLKAKLNSFGLKLILDFVPNHLAFDHPWTMSEPGYFVHANRTSLEAHPEWFFPTEQGTWLAHGRDPFFSPWTDTVQVNFFSKATRKALIGELSKIAEVADGVRCDMAMLGLNSIFEKVWGNHIKEKPLAKEFWEEAIPEVKNRFPQFIFIAEVYWDLEWTLQQMGFNFTYDKKLYDRLFAGNPRDIQGHLKAEPAYQARSMRFIENHDEDRVLTHFGREKSLAAAIVIGTIPGLRFFQDGQLEGKRIRTPVHLRRETDEKADAGIVDFYRQLLSFMGAPVLQYGQWKLLELFPAWEGNLTSDHILAWSWYDARDWKIIVVNYSIFQSQGRIPWLILSDKNKTIRIRDRRTGVLYERERKELENEGLFVDLRPWQAHLFEPA